MMVFIILEVFPESKKKSEVFDDPGTVENVPLFAIFIPNEKIFTF